MAFRLLHVIVLLGIACLVAGCSKPTSKELAAGIIADKKLDDAEAMKKLAELAFKNSEAVSVAKLDDGEIALSVTVHPSKDAEVKTLQGGPSAVVMDSNFVLGMTVFGGRQMVEYGRQRKLARLIIQVKHTLLDETGNKVDVDIFGYTLSKESFDAYLTTGSYMDLVKGKALDTIEKTCVIDYNHFDQVRYQKDK
jgi:hypothetical protein